MKNPKQQTSKDDLADLVNQATLAVELADPDADSAPLDRIVNRVAEAAGVAVLATIVALVFGNAFGRYLFSAPIIWSEEIVVALMPWLAMLGVFLSVRRRQLIRIEYFVSHLGFRVITTIETITQFLCAATFLFFAYYGLNYLILFGLDQTIYLRLPRGWFTSAFSLGAAIVAISFLINAVQTLRRNSSRTTI